MPLCRSSLATDNFAGRTTGPHSRRRAQAPSAYVRTGPRGCGRERGTGRRAGWPASRTLLARCLASHLQGEPHGFEPPFCKHHSSQPRLTTTGTGMASSSQVRPHLGVARGRPRTRRAHQRCMHDNVCLRLDALMRIPDGAWVPFFQSHSNILDLDLDLACAAVLGFCSRPPRFLDES